MIACTPDVKFDASGNFEADEVIVSAQQNGILLSYNIEEGRTLQAGDTVGHIDVTLLELQKEYVMASMAALREKTVSVVDQEILIQRQLDVQKTQLQYVLQEKIRLENLVNAEAATRKQLDDQIAYIDQLEKQIAVTEQQLQVTRSTITSQNRGILSEREPLEKLAEQYQEQINRGTIVNPVQGTILTNYARAGEMQTIGKPLYKIANLESLDLRAYVTGDQLSQIQLGQSVAVHIDDGLNGFREYPGTIVWISDKSEFSPRNIQTKKERANLVYAIKVKVPNDGFLKIGMYGEVNWSM
jgi:HlyD family secretion protein